MVNIRRKKMKLTGINKKSGICKPKVQSHKYIIHDSHTSACFRYKKHVILKANFLALTKTRGGTQQRSGHRVTGESLLGVSRKVCFSM